LFAIVLIWGNCPTGMSVGSTGMPQDIQDCIDNFEGNIEALNASLLEANEN
jgi:hypothetical protein